MLNVFEQATKQRLRFPQPANRGGVINTEDLWALSLEDLDDIAKALNKKVKESSEESFIKKQSTADKKASLQLEVVVSIINTKLKEEERRKNAAERKTKRDKILALMAEKQDTAMAKKSLASLQAELDKLEDEDEVED